MLPAFDEFGRNVLKWPSVMLACPNEGALSRSPFFSPSELTDKRGDSKVSTWNILWNKLPAERSQVRRLQTHERPFLVSSWSCWFHDRSGGDRVIRSRGYQEL